MEREAAMNALMAVLVAIAAIEVGYAWVSRRAVHDFRGALSSLALGIGQQAINVYLSAGMLAIFAGVHARFAITSADLGTWWHWLLFVPACDLCYYVAHRTAHTVNFWVAAHIVHHQAEDYNHLSAMRQSWTAWIVNFPFFLPLALFVPLEMFAVGQLGIMFVQFLSHNGVFRGSLGPLDRLMITPANHRVHHGLDRPYLGMNCGGMFVIWDRVFGTFVEEDPKIPLRLGTGLDVNFHDPIEANLDYYRRVVFVMRKRRGFMNKVAIWFQSPEVLFRELSQHGYARRPSPTRAVLDGSQRVLLGVALVACAVALFVHRLGYDGNPWPLRLVTGLLVLAAVAGFGRLLSTIGVDQRSPSALPGSGLSDVSPR
jgi:alkylglycerol monooxygenase